MILTHLRRHIVAYLALSVALLLGLSTVSYAAGIVNGSVTAKKLHKNAVTSKKIKNGTIRPKDLKKPTFVQSQMLLADNPPAVPDGVGLAPYDFILPERGRTVVTVFIPTIGGSCDGGSNAQPQIGLYIDGFAAPATGTIVAPFSRDRSVQLTTTLDLARGVHAGRVGLTCPGGSGPNYDAPGAKTWTIVQADG